MSKPLVRIALALAALLLLAVVLVPLFVNADTFRPELQQQLSTSLKRNVTFGHLSFSLLSGSLVADDIAIADDPAFSSAPFLSAQSLHVGVEVAPLLLHRQLHITGIVIASPSIQLIQSARGPWNFSTLGGSAGGSTSQPAAPIPDFTVGRLAITNGTATVSSLPAVGKPFVYSGLNLTITGFSFVQAFPFQLAAALPGDGTLQLNGTAGPLSPKDAADTPFQATLQLKHFDPVAADLLSPDKGILLVADIDSKLSSDGDNIASSGTVHATQLQLARTGSPAPHPVDITYAVTDDLDARSGRVTDLAVHTGTVAVHVTGTFSLAPQGTSINLQLAAPNLPIDQVEQLLPAFGVRLPSGSSLRGGTLSANLNVSGPIAASTIAGPVEVDNTQLAGFDLGSKIQGLNPFGNSGGGTTIQTLRATVDASPRDTQLSNIYASLPQLGTATGNGTVSPSNQLDFNLVATLNANTGVGQIASQAASAIGGFFGGLLHQTVSKGVPLTITGSASNPSIHANLGALLR